MMIRLLLATAAVLLCCTAAMKSDAIFASTPPSNSQWIDVPAASNAGVLVGAVRAASGSPSDNAAVLVRRIAMSLDTAFLRWDVELGISVSDPFSPTNFSRVGYESDFWLWWYVEWDLPAPTLASALRPGSTRNCSTAGPPGQLPDFAQHPLLNCSNLGVRVSVRFNDVDSVMSSRPILQAFQLWQWTGHAWQQPLHRMPHYLSYYDHPHAVPGSYLETERAMAGPWAASGVTVTRLVLQVPHHALHRQLSPEGHILRGGVQSASSGTPFDQRWGTSSAELRSSLHEESNSMLVAQRPSGAVGLRFPQPLRIINSERVVCMLSHSGYMQCWGWDYSVEGLLGRRVSPPEIGSTSSPGEHGFVDAAGTTPLIEVVVGSRHTCSIDVHGAVRCFGSSSNGALGYPGRTEIGYSVVSSSVGTVRVSGDEDDITVAMCAGHDFSCAILASGSIQCWGNGGSGRLGNLATNHVGDDEHPFEGGAVDLGGAVPLQIVCQRQSACVLLQDLSVVCWGGNSEGQLGLGHTTNVGDSPSRPVRPGGNVDTGTEVPLQLAAAREAMCAVFSNHRVKCWGDSGGVGVIGWQPGSGGDDTWGNDPGETPAAAPFLSFGHRIHSVHANSAAENVCVLPEDGGRMVCWGRNDRGQLGDSRIADGDHTGDVESPRAEGYSPTPQGEHVTLVSHGTDSGCVVTTVAVRCWGANNGKHAQGSFADFGTAASGVSIEDINPVYWLPRASEPVLQDSPWFASLVLGERRVSSPTVAVNFHDGRVRAFAPSAPPRFITHVSLHRLAMAVLTSKGTVMVAGRNDNGQLGRRGEATAWWGIREGETWQNSLELVPAVGVKATHLANSDTSIGIVFSDGSAGVLGTGSVRGFSGAQNFGGDSSHYLKDIQVANLGAHKAVRISAGENHFCVVTDASRLFCWGRNDNGQLGIGSSTNQAEPQEVAIPGATVLQADAYHTHTCAVVQHSGSQRGVRCWGRFDFGRTGVNGASGNVLSPPVSDIDMGISGAQATAVVAGLVTSCALLATPAGDTPVKCWGKGAGGATGIVSASDFGDDEAVSSLPAVDLGPVQDIVALAMGFDIACALRAAGTVNCWGDLSPASGGGGSLGPTPAKGAAGDISFGDGVHIVAIAVGTDNVRCVTSQGDLVGFGEGEGGRFGLGNQLDYGRFHSAETVGAIPTEASVQLQPFWEYAALSPRVGLVGWPAMHIAPNGAPPSFTCYKCSARDVTVLPAWMLTTATTDASQTRLAVRSAGSAAGFTCLAAQLPTAAVGDEESSCVAPVLDDSLPTAAALLQVASISIVPSTSSVLNLAGGQQLVMDGVFWAAFLLDTRLDSTSIQVNGRQCEGLRFEAAATRMVCVVPALNLTRGLSAQWPAAQIAFLHVIDGVPSPLNVSALPIPQVQWSPPSLVSIVPATSVPLEGAHVLVTAGNLGVPALSMAGLVRLVDTRDGSDACVTGTLVHASDDQLSCTLRAGWRNKTLLVQVAGQDSLGHSTRGTLQVHFNGPTLRAAEPAYALTTASASAQMLNAFLLGSAFAPKTAAAECGSLCRLVAGTGRAECEVALGTWSGADSLPGTCWQALAPPAAFGETALRLGGAACSSLAVHAGGALLRCQGLNSSQLSTRADAIQGSIAGAPIVVSSAAQFLVLAPPELSAARPTLLAAGGNQVIELRGNGLGVIPGDILSINLTNPDNPQHTAACTSVQLLSSSAVQCATPATTALGTVQTPRISIALASGEVAHADGLVTYFFPDIFSVSPSQVQLAAPGSNRTLTVAVSGASLVAFDATTSQARLPVFHVGSQTCSELGGAIQSDPEGRTLQCAGLLASRLVATESSQHRHAGTVWLLTADGIEAAAAPNSLRVLGAPVVSSISPATAAPGQTVNILGSNLGADATDILQVRLGGVLLAPNVTRLGRTAVSFAMPPAPDEALVSLPEQIAMPVALTVAGGWQLQSPTVAISFALAQTPAPRQAPTQVCASRRRAAGARAMQLQFSYTPGPVELAFPIQQWRVEVATTPAFEQGSTSVRLVAFADATDITALQNTSASSSQRTLPEPISVLGVSPSAAVDILSEKAVADSAAEFAAQSCSLQTTSPMVQHAFPLQSSRQLQQLEPTMATSRYEILLSSMPDATVWVRVSAVSDAVAPELSSGPTSAALGPFLVTCSYSEYMTTNELLPGRGGIAAVGCEQCPVGAVCRGAPWEFATSDAGFYLVPWSRQQFGLLLLQCEREESCRRPNDVQWGVRMVASAQLASVGDPAALTATAQEAVTAAAAYAEATSSGQTDPAPAFSTDCEVGYSGTLCNQCASGFARSSGECGECAEPWRVWLAAFGGLLLTTLLLIFFTISAVEANQLDGSVAGITINKLLASHLQQIALAASLPLAWPGPVEQLLVWAATLSSGPENVISFDCVDTFGSPTPVVSRAVSSLLLPILLPLPVMAVTLAWPKFIKPRIAMPCYRSSMTLCGPLLRYMGCVFGDEARRAVGLPAAPRQPSAAAAPRPMSGVGGAIVLAIKPSKLASATPSKGDGASPSLQAAKAPAESAAGARVATEGGDPRRGTCGDSDDEQGIAVMPLTPLSPSAPASPGPSEAVGSGRSATSQRRRRRQSSSAGATVPVTTAVRSSKWFLGFTTFIVVAVNLHMNLVQASLSVLSWREIGDRRVLAADLDLQVSDHRGLLLGIGLSGMVVFGLGIVLAAGVLMYVSGTCTCAQRGWCSSSRLQQWALRKAAGSKRSSVPPAPDGGPPLQRARTSAVLQQLEQAEAGGFTIFNYMQAALLYLTDTYKVELSYWELVVQTRKVMLTMVAVLMVDFGPQVQVATASMVLVSFLLAQDVLEPYVVPGLNALESASLTVAVLTYSAGPLLLATGQLSLAVRQMVTALVVVLNFAYFVILLLVMFGTWGYGASRSAVEQVSTTQLLRAAFVAPDISPYLPEDAERLLRMFEDASVDHDAANGGTGTTGVHVLADKLPVRLDDTSTPLGGEGGVAAGGGDVHRAAMDTSSDAVGTGPASSALGPAADTVDDSEEAVVFTKTEVA